MSFSSRGWTVAFLKFQTHPIKVKEERSAVPISVGLESLMGRPFSAKIDSQVE